MFLYLHITRLLFYIILGFAAWFGELPWWVPVGWVLWDTHLHIMIKVPFTTPKVPPFDWNNYKGPENHA